MYISSWLSLILSDVLILLHMLSRIIPMKNMNSPKLMETVSNNLYIHHFGKKG